MAKELKYPEAIVNWSEDERPDLREMKKEIFKTVLLHNHPSGEPEPSQEDIEITNRIISACELVGIEVLDHIIYCDNNYFSFFNEGLIKEG